VIVCDRGTGHQQHRMLCAPAFGTLFLTCRLLRRMRRRYARLLAAGEALAAFPLSSRPRPMRSRNIPRSYLRHSAAF
jgi:hypothetical protein